MKKLETKKTKPTFIISTFKTDIIKVDLVFLSDVRFRLFAMRDLQICNIKITLIIFVPVCFSYILSSWGLTEIMQRCNPKLLKKRTFWQFLVVFYQYRNKKMSKTGKYVIYGQFSAEDQPPILPELS